MERTVVLLGPPGSGKSSISEALAHRGLRRRDWESALLERWGSRKRFLAAKDDTLAALHREIEDWIGEADPPAVIETTGLSDAPLLGALVRHPTLIVRLDVSEEVAVRRVQGRPRGFHLNDGADANRRIWQAFDEQVAPHQPVHLVIDTEATTVEAAADLIIEALSS